MQPITHDEIFYSLMIEHIKDDNTFSKCKAGHAVLRVLENVADQQEALEDTNELAVHNIGTINLIVLDEDQLDKLRYENNISIVRMYGLNPVVTLTKKDR